MDLRPPRSATPVVVVTGFLGAGKTTLLNRLLREPEVQDTAVIVNEFGEIGLDHALVEGGQDQVMLLDAGCLCCVLAGSLRETLVDLYQRRATSVVPPFRRVIIETSGLADPAPVLEAVTRDPLLAGRFDLGPVLCVVDACFGLRTLAENPEARAQVAMADRILISKGSPSPELSEALAQINPLAAIKDIAGVANPAALLEANHAWHPAAARQHGHDGDIAAHCFRRPGAVTWAGIADWTGHLAERWGDQMLRCKALIEIEGLAGPVLVQGVRDRFAVTRLGAWPDAERGGRFVFIGKALDWKELERGLAWLVGGAEAEDPGLTAIPAVAEIER